MSFLYNNKTIFNGLSNSENFNNFINDIIYEIVEMSKKINESDICIEDANELIHFENTILGNKIKNLTEKLEDIKNTQKSFRDGNNFIHKTIKINSDECEIVNGTIDKNYDIITPEIISKRSRTNINSTTMPNTFIRIYESYDKINWILKDSSVTNEKLKNITNTSTNKVYTTKTLSYDNKSKLYILVEIDFDYMAINNLYINNIIIDAIPSLTLNLTDVKIKTLENNKVTINTYPRNNNDNATIHDITKTTIHFPKTQAKGIMLYFEHDNPISVNENDIIATCFYYGFRTIDACLIEYNSNNIEISYTIKTDNYIKYMATPESIKEECSAQIIKEEYELYIEYNGTLIKHEFNKNISIPSKKVIIKHIARITGENIPIIKGLKLKYKTI